MAKSQKCNKNQKIKIKKNELRHKLPTTQTNPYTKFHENPSTTLAYITIIVRTDNGERRTDAKKFIAVSHS